MPVLGITGTGGSGKSSLTDELLRRLRLDQEDKLRIAVIAVDPTRRKGGGALLGDRIRMNTLDSGQVYFRSLATRGAKELPEALDDIIAAAKAAGFDLVIVETPGIGQGDAAIVPHVDVPIYVMTPEFGAASQLEKIDMLDFAEAVVINKFDRRGADDALRDVRRQLVRNREAFELQARRDAGVRHGGVAASTTTASPRCTSTCGGCWSRRACGCRPRARWPRSENRISSAVSPIVPPDAVPLPGRDRRRAAGLPRPTRPGPWPPPGTARRWRRPGSCWPGGTAWPSSTTADLDAALADAERRCRPPTGSCSRTGRRWWSSTPATSWS